MCPLNAQIAVNHNLTKCNKQNNQIPNWVEDILYNQWLIDNFIIKCLQKLLIGQLFQKRKGKTILKGRW